MSSPTSKTVKLNLGGKDYELYFDLNTYAAFEEVSGKFFTDMLFDIQSALQASEEAKDPTLMIRKIPLKQLRYFLWAACHYYDADGEPVWPLTIGKLGSLINTSNLGQILPTLMNGISGNMPDAPAEKPDAEVNGKVRPIDGAMSSPASGGTEFGPSDEVVLASLDRNSTV